jgi:hypothetical protein
MQLLELIDYGPNTSGAHKKKRVEILEILPKMSVEDAKNHPKRPYG